MPITEIISAPVERPASATTVRGEPSPPFWVCLSSEGADLVDLTGAPEEALKKAGIKAGWYWLPQYLQYAAQPGVNGVTADPSWKSQDILAKGRPRLAENCPWHLMDGFLEIPQE